MSQEKKPEANPPAPEEGREEPLDSKIRIEIEYDMAASSLTMKSRAPTVILQGVLTQALSMITQNQVLSRLQAIQAKARIVNPAGERVS